MPRDKIEAYRRIAAAAGKIWRDHGALEFRECVGEDLEVKDQRPFPHLAQTQKGETVVFSWIVYRSRAHRDAVNAKVMEDPRMQELMQEPMSFDCARMSYGGFQVIVDA